MNDTCGYCGRPVTDGQEQIIGEDVPYHYLCFGKARSEGKVK